MMAKKLRKQYSKPKLVRYGNVHALTLSGHPGLNMDSIKKQDKTGF